MNRYRIITETGDEQHISSVVLSSVQARKELVLEETLHEIAGWQTRREGEQLLCSKDGLTRTIAIRKSTPLDDEIT